MNIRRPFLFILAFLGNLLAVSAQDADIDVTGRTEIQLLAGETITVTLSGATYVRTGALSPQAFILKDAPAGLSVTDVDATSTTEADVSLITTDFDVDYPYFHITIHDSVLSVTDSIETDTCALTANVERAVLTSSPLPLSEHDIGSGGTTAYLDIFLNNTEYFTSNGNDLHIDSITLINFPAGVEKDHFDFGAPTTNDKARLYVKYTPGDFDGDITDAGLTINAGCLQYSTDSLGTDTLFIRAVQESLGVSSTSSLEERDLNNAWIEVELANDETLIKNGPIDTNQFYLIDFPPGVYLDSAESNLTGSRIAFGLGFDYTDFDANDSDGRIAVKPSALTWNKTDSLSTTAGEIVFVAYDEVISAGITPDESLHEYNLDGRVLTVKITDDWIDEPLSFVQADLQLVDNLSNLAIDHIVVNDSSEFEVYLSQPVYEDFDSDENIYFSILNNKLHYSGNLDTDPETITAKPENPSAFIMPDDSLKEYTLDQRSIEVKLTDDWLTDAGSFSASVLTLSGAPSGLDIEDISITDSSQFTVNFKFSYTDFDSDSELSLIIPFDELYQQDGTDLESNDTTVYAKFEVPVATLDPDQALEEYSLKGRSIVVRLFDEWIIDTSTFDTLDLSFGGAPEGLHFDSLTIKDSSEFTVYLDHEYVDFDTDSNFTLRINHNELLQTEGPADLESETEVIDATLENPKAVLTGVPFPLQEYDLDGKSLNVWLEQEWIRKTVTLTVPDLSLLHTPEGLEIESISITDSANFTVHLKDTYHDFDTDSLLQLSINKDKLLQSTSLDLVSDTTLVEAYVETPAAEITPDIPLEEYGLDGRTILLEMDEEWIIDTSDFDKTNVALVDAPAGLSVASAIPLDSASVMITLVNVITDFDSDYELKIRVDSSKLVQSITMTHLVSDTTLVDAYLEHPEADMTPSSWLREFFLDTMSLDIEFTEEVFAGTPNISHFGLYHAPPGLSIEGLANIADSSVTVLLEFNATDFDVPYTDVKVSISHAILIQTESDSLRTASFEIRPNIEPVVSSVSIPNDTMMIGDVVEAGIILSEYTVDSVYSLAGGSIGSYGLDSLEWVSDSQYKAWFTVAEGGTDYLAPDPIPVSGLRLNDLPVQGVVHNSSIVQGSDLLDANKPVVGSITVIGQEDKQIGDDVILLISAFEEGLVSEDTSEVNLVPMSEPNVLFEDIDGGSYTITYTVQGGDQNVAPGALVSKIYLKDYAGNINDTYPAIKSNVLSIDASVPVINSITNITPADTVIIGEEVTLAVQADEVGYGLADDSEVNGFEKNEGLIFSSVGTTYYVRYPVKEDDPEVAVGDLKAKIILQDAAGNRSLPDSVILDNDVAVLTKRPTALLTGNDEICLNDTATLYITLTGAAPWKLKYHDAVDSYYIEDILTTDYTLRIGPTQTMSYAIDSVWDGTGNENVGVGNSLVIVNPLPEVSIVNLGLVYSVENSGVTLEGNPIGGKFYGPGVITEIDFFSPPDAGITGGVPHVIRYEYTDAKGCFNVDSQEVEIVESEVDWTWLDSKNPDNRACYLDETFTAKAINTDGTTGSFTITENDIPYPAGFMVDNGDNTATLHPSILDWSGITTEYERVGFIIRYDYLDKDSVALYDTDSLEVEYFDSVEIVEFEKVEACSNEPVIPITGNKSTGVFEGPGVLDLDGYKGEFHPNLADIGMNWIIYTYKTTNNCEQKDSARIIVHEAPDPEFIYLDSCVLEDGGRIGFRNTSDTAGLGGTLKWEWVYGDIPSGEENRDEFHTMQDGFHHYPGPGRRTVTLTATVLETGCNSYESITKDLGNTPDVGISWNTECFTSAPVQFTGESVTEDGDSLFRWKITDFSGTEIAEQEGPALKTLDYTFSSIDNYSIEFTAITENGCFASVYDTIYLRPFIRNITDEAPYLEGFEGDAAGWYAFALPNSPQKSWKLNTVGPGRFPYDLPDDGNRAWYTELARNDTSEQSWVSSPCFDFSNMRRPMISLDRKVSSDRNVDGTALQYTYDDGQTWHNVGAVDDGSINWYNTFRILNGPGEQGEGWTGAFEFDSLEEWKQSRHDLDELIGKSRVQFRIAYGSSGSAVYPNKGFAFDNVWIGERSRVVLFEHFSNSGMTESTAADQQVNQLVGNNPRDVIDLQYHAEVEGYTDRMNEDNPAPASARSLFYGTRQVPYMLIDGGLGGSLAYDFSETELDTLDLYTRALVDPSFDIGLAVDEQDGKLDITIDLTALDTLENREYIVYTAIIEKLIDDPAYTGSGSVTAFENVVRAMVPNAAGVSLIRGWNPGDTENIPLSWDISDIILDEEMVNVVVFVQGADNRMVYQAASNDPDLNSDPVIPSVGDYLKARNLSMMVWPNPAADKVSLAFAGALPAQVEVQVFTHTGSLVRNSLLPAGTETYEMDISGLAKGVYFIRALEKRKIIGTQKLLILR